MKSLEQETAQTQQFLFLKPKNFGQSVKIYSVFPIM